MDRPATQLLQVGAWCLNTRTGEITRPGEVVRLEERAFRVLLCLCERPGEVVSSDELLNQAWPGVVVSQDSVYQAVASLRRILGDDPKRPDYIATVPRLGYRLLAPVGPWSNETAPTVERAASQASGPGGTRRRTLVLIVALFAVVAATLYLTLGRSVPRSVAVLPFLDLTTERMDKEYLADGITEELIGKLSAIPELMVPAPTASFQFKGKKIAVSDFGKALDVGYVLDGSIRESKDTLRIAARLVRASDGFILWSGSFDRPLGDELAIEDSVARAIANEVRQRVH
jgi:TolB-like protein/DNA-binding winged helix-turn-helix (wHTH) protein